MQQFDHSTGTLVASIPLPAASIRPTSLTFGGPDLSELYVTTRSDDGGSGYGGNLLRVLVPGVKGASAAKPFGN